MSGYDRLKKNHTKCFLSNDSECQLLMTSDKTYVYCLSLHSAENSNLGIDLELVLALRSLLKQKAGIQLTAEDSEAQEKTQWLQKTMTSTDSFLSAEMCTV